MVTKDADGTWNEDLCTSSYVGYGGVGETTEWNQILQSVRHDEDNAESLEFPGGCISVPEDQMITILKNVQPGCQTIIDSASELKNY